MKPSVRVLLSFSGTLRTDVPFQRFDEGEACGNESVGCGRGCGLD